MPDFTPGQTLFLDRSKKARGWCEEMAEQANRMQLVILAREWAVMGKQLEDAIANQERAFRNGTLAQLDFNSGALHHPQEGEQ